MQAKTEAVSNAAKIGDMQAKKARKIRRGEGSSAAAPFFTTVSSFCSYLQFFLSRSKKKLGGENEKNENKNKSEENNYRNE